MLIFLAILSLGTPPGRSATCPAGAGTRPAIVVSPLLERRDTTVTVHVCLAAPIGRRIGSYHGELLFDPTGGRVIHAEHPNEGMRVENTGVAGKVTFAGAMPNGLGSGELLVVQLRSASLAHPIAIRVRILELNDLNGRSLLGELRVDSAAATSLSDEVSPMAMHPLPRSR
jgi:hypothetical protein